MKSDAKVEKSGLMRKDSVRDKATLGGNLKNKLVTLRQER